MTDNNSIWQHPIIYFITRLSILGGMMLVFAGVSYAIAFYTIPTLFKLNVLENPNLLTDMSNPTVVNALKYIQGVTSIGLFIYPAWHFGKVINQPPAEYLKINRKTKPSEVYIGILAVFAFMPFISWLMWVNQQLHLPNSLAHIEQWMKQSEDAAALLTIEFLKADNIYALFINLLVIAVLPAIGEEFLFRGALQNFFRQVTRNKHAAVWLVAIIFSAVHGQFFGFFPRVFLGAVLGYAYLFTGNLWVSVLMHAANNGFAVLCTYAPINQQLPPLLQDGYVFESWLINVGSLLAGVAIIWWLRTITFKRVWYNGE